MCVLSYTYQQERQTLIQTKERKGSIMAELTAFQNLSNVAKSEVKAWCKARSNELEAFMLLASMSDPALNFIRKHQTKAIAK